MSKNKLKFKVGDFLYMDKDDVMTYVSDIDHGLVTLESEPTNTSRVIIVVTEKEIQESSFPSDMIILEC